MANMRPDKNPMPHQDPVVRSGNFEEVALGYTKEQAIDEAQRCLSCKNMPCVAGCPVKIHIPAFIAKVAEGDFEAAYQIIAADSALPAVCGRVCPQETQCESKCVRGIKHESVGIGRLERFVADWHNANCTEQPVRPASNGHKVAVIGSGPSGLTCAGDLARKGYEVTVYEALHLAGGVLVYGIPEFRLPKSIVQKEVDGLKALGVKIETNVVVGRSITIDELMEQEGFEAVFIGSGAGLPMFMHIPGENLKGVYSANEFLTRINLMKAYKDGSDTPIMPLKGKKVAVVGGGNVAMDAARCSRRLGADVYIVYRRSEAELPARAEEVEHAKEEGIIFKTLTNPTAILGYNNPEDKRDPKNGSVCGLTCVEMELGEPDASGRRRPIVKEGSEFEMEMDCVIMALGTSPNPLIKSTTKGLEINKRGGIIVNEDGLTSREAVYAPSAETAYSSTVMPRSAKAASRRSISPGMEMGSPQAAMALATSLSPLPVTTLTTAASLSIRPCSQSFFSPAAPVTPAGSPNTPQVLPSSFWAAMISASDTFTVSPLDSRIAISALSAFRGTPTAMESARVFSSMGRQSSPVSMARFRGQQPSAWAEMSRGSRSMRPMACRSLSPFHSPAMVHPSPTEMAM